MQFVLQVKNEMGSGISQATGQIKGLGDAAEQTQTKAKSSGMGIGQAFQFVALNAFNLASSLIQTKRSYEDLAKQENAHKNAQLNVTVATNRLQNAEIALQKARKKGDPLAIAKAENNLQNAKIRVQKATNAERFSQIDLNRAHQDFYLNIIPNVISGLGTMFGLFQVLQGSGGIGGLASSFAKLAIPLGGIVLAFTAIKTNFLGFRDFLSNLGRDIGNAVPGLKPFLNVLEAIGGVLGLTPKKTNLNKAIADLRKSFEPLLKLGKDVIDNIMKGNWAGAFDVIRKAAVSFWHNLVVTIPFFGLIDTVIAKIRAGDWPGAFKAIETAAIKFWQWLKTNVPFLADVETMIRSIIEGDWKGAFEAIKKGYKDSGVQDTTDKMFGPNWIAKIIEGFNLLPQQLKANLNDPQRGWDRIIEGTVLEKIANAFHPEDIGKGLGARIIKSFSSGFNLTEGGGKGGELWGDDPNPPGKQLMDALGKNAAAWVKNAVDPAVKSLFEAKTWTDAFAAINKTHPLTDAWNFLIGALFPRDQKTGKGTGGFQTQVNDVANQIVKGIADFFTENMPQTGAKVAGVSKIVNSFWSALKITWDQIPGPSALFLNIVNGIIKGITDNITFDNAGKVIHKIVNVLTNTASQVKDDFVRIGERFWGWIWSGLLGAGGALLKFGQDIGIIPKAGSSTGGGSSGGRGGGRAAGFHGVATGPMLIGERGLEQVDVTPMSDIVNRRNNGGMLGGYGPIIIHTHFHADGRELSEIVAKHITRNQSTYR